VTTIRVESGLRHRRTQVLVPSLWRAPHQIVCLSKTNAVQKLELNRNFTQSYRQHSRQENCKGPSPPNSDSSIPFQSLHNPSLSSPIALVHSKNTPHHRPTSSTTLSLSPLSPPPPLPRIHIFSLRNPTPLHQHLPPPVPRTALPVNPHTPHPSSQVAMYNPRPANCRPTPPPPSVIIPPPPQTNPLNPPNPKRIIPLPQPIATNLIPLPISKQSISHLQREEHPPVSNASRCARPIVAFLLSGLLRQ